LILAAAVGLVAADHLGAFGWRGDDMSRYDGTECTVADDVDGDTFYVGVPDGDRPRTCIRLWGVDTPETRGQRPGKATYFGPQASARTKELTLGRRVRLQLLPARTRCRYGRVLAYVFLPDGRMLNRLLVEEGYAYADPRFDHPLAAEFRTAMRRARRGGKGLWAGVSESQLPYYLRPKTPPEAGRGPTAPHRRAGASGASPADPAGRS